MLKLLVALAVVFCSEIAAQQLDKIEPPNWWSGMKHNKIQLMIYGKDLKDASVEFNSDKLKVIKVHDTENSSCLFVDIEISDDADEAEYNLTLNANGKTLNHKFPIYKRLTSDVRHQGFNPKDIIYLITPDRFANADTTNDFAADMNDRRPVTSNVGRHGGDIQGIINKLDYIKELGVTAIWITPVIENDTRVSYHGYAATDLYKVDPRFGSNELYKKLVEEAHKHGLKVIYDHVNNHIGVTHPWIKNLPMKDWINGSVEQHHTTPHFNVAIKDPNADTSITRFSQTGWFVNDMPDLNQRNPYLANYLIQNTIWWIESTGLDGIREDTYPYPDQEYLSLWAAEIFKEYPDFNIVGEVWIGDPLILSAFQKDSPISEINTNLPSVTDFALRDAVEKAFAPNGSLSEIYETISRDAGYTNPNYLVTFLDNHDITRIMYITEGEINKFKMALMLLLTTRGIPQLYYGTEIGIMGGRDHGSIRADFPGGFSNSDHDAFTEKGRTEKEAEAYDFVKSLIKIRKLNPELSEGKLIHYPIMDEIYCYFRELENERSFILLNNNKEHKKINLTLLSNKLPKGKVLKNLLTGTEKVIAEDMMIDLEPEQAVIYKLLQ